MAIQPTRPEAYDTGTLNQYAHIYDVQAEEKRARIAEETEEAARIAADDAEKQARIEADDAEKQARIAADDAEKQARIAADDALGKRIDASAVEQMTPIKLTDDDKTASRQPVASGTRSLAFGPGAKATANQSVALGAFSQTSSRGNTVSVGSENLQRRIEYVNDPQMDTDAVNLRYFNENSSNLSTLDLSLVKTDSDGKLTPDSAIYLSSIDNVNPLITKGVFEWKKVRVGNTSQVYEAYAIQGSLVNIFNIKVIDSATGTSKTTVAFVVPCYLSLFQFAWLVISLDTMTNFPVGYVSINATLTDETLGIDSFSRLYVNLDSARGGIESGTDGLYATVAAQNTKGIVQGSDSITITGGVAKVNPSIFGDGLATADGKVSVDTGFVGEHLAGDALYYDTANGLMVKTGTGLHIDNDTLSVDQDTLPLASADNRGTVKVGSGLAIAKDGTLSANVTTMEYRKASNENITCDGMTLTDYVYLANTSYPKYDVTYYGQATKAFASGTKVTVDIATNTDTFNSYGCVEMSVNGLTLAIDSISLDENGDRLKQAVFSVSKAIGIGDYVRFKLYF